MLGQQNYVTTSTLSFFRVLDCGESMDSSLMNIPWIPDSVMQWWSWLCCLLTVLTGIKHYVRNNGDFMIHW